MRAQHHAQARFGQEIGLVAVQGDAHPRRDTVWRRILQPDLIQCQPRLVGKRSIDVDHAPFDSTIITKGQNRGRNQMRPQISDQSAAKHQSKCRGRNLPQFRPTSGHGCGADPGQTDQAKKQRRRFRRHREVITDPHRQKHRGPRQKLTARRQRHFQQEPQRPACLMTDPAHLVSPLPNA